MATLITMNFMEAISLYKKCGYKIKFERKDKVNKTSQLFLRKRLIILSKY